MLLRVVKNIAIGFISIITIIFSQFFSKSLHLGGIIKNLRINFYLVSYSPHHLLTDSRKIAKKNTILYGENFRLFQWHVAIWTHLAFYVQVISFLFQITFLLIFNLSLIDFENIFVVCRNNRVFVQFKTLLWR